jgi:hypothetical protein
MVSGVERRGSVPDMLNGLCGLFHICVKKKKELKRNLKAEGVNFCVGFSWLMNP